MGHLGLGLPRWGVCVCELHLHRLTCLHLCLPPPSVPHSFSFPLPVLLPAFSSPSPLLIHRCDQKSGATCSAEGEDSSELREETWPGISGSSSCCRCFIPKRPESPHLGCAGRRTVGSISHAAQQGDSSWVIFAGARTKCIQSVERKPLEAAQCPLLSIWLWQPKLWNHWHLGNPGGHSLQ